jgi:hypothetical protein
VDIRFSSGPGAGPHIGVIGVWDPPRLSHEQLFNALAYTAREKSYSSLVITLDPAPVSYSVEGEWAVHSGLEFRQALQRRCNIDTIASARLTPAEVHEGADYFLRQLCGRINLVELWLGHNQTLGRFRPGSKGAILTSCRDLGMHCKILPPITGLPPKGQVEKLLRRGKIAEASVLASGPPVWGRPLSGSLHLAWQPGIYIVRPYGLDTAASQKHREELTLHLTQRGATRTIQWPHLDVDWVAFILGPGDTAAALAE